MSPALPLTWSTNDATTVMSYIGLILCVNTVVIIIKNSQERWFYIYDAL